MNVVNVYSSKYFQTILIYNFKHIALITDGFLNDGILTVC